MGIDVITKAYCKLSLSLFSRAIGFRLEDTEYKIGSLIDHGWQKNSDSYLEIMCHGNLSP